MVLATITPPPSTYSDPTICCVTFNGDVADTVTVTVGLLVTAPLPSVIRTQSLAFAVSFGAVKVGVGAADTGSVVVPLCPRYH